MRAYGMNLREFDDADSAGCREHGHASAVYGLANNPEGDIRALRSLRGGKRAKNRRVQKRRARRASRTACTEV